MVQFLKAIDIRCFLLLDTFFLDHVNPVLLNTWCEIALPYNEVNELDTGRCLLSSEQNRSPLSQFLETNINGRQWLTARLSTVSTSLRFTSLMGFFRIVRFWKLSNPHNISITIRFLFWIFIGSVSDYILWTYRSAFPRTYLCSPWFYPNTRTLSN
jgi:hypothetical protein